MEKREVMENVYRRAFVMVILCGVFGLSFAAGIIWSTAARAEDDRPAKKAKIVYPKRTDLDFEGIHLQGEIQNPGEFYFQHRPEEKFDSLVKRRPNFHREMLRDAVLSK
jgi:hypothetical protein